MEGQDAQTQGQQEKCKEMMGGFSGMEMCPMASMCKGMMEKPGMGYLLMVPGAILVSVGVLMLVKPRILFWLVPGKSILLGVIMMAFANFMRKMAGKIEPDRI